MRLIGMRARRQLLPLDMLAMGGCHPGNVNVAWQSGEAVVHGAVQTEVEQHVFDAKLDDRLIRHGQRLRAQPQRIAVHLERRGEVPVMNQALMKLEGERFRVRAFGERQLSVEEFIVELRGGRRGVIAKRLERLTDPRQVRCVHQDVNIGHRAQPNVGVGCLGQDNALEQQRNHAMGVQRSQHRF